MINGTFSDDAQHALTTSPRYFLTWYTAKSLALVAVTAAFAFMLGRATVKR